MSSRDRSQLSPTPVGPRLPTHLTDPYVIGAWFNSLDEAIQALIQYTVARGLSYKPWKGNDKQRYNIDCRSNECPFRLRLTQKASGFVETTVYNEHCCTPDVHFNWHIANSTKYLQPIVNTYRGLWITSDYLLWTAYKHVFSYQKASSKICRLTIDLIRAQITI